jgi:hypothetical protein
LLTVGLVPPEALAVALGELRLRHPGAEITALLGARTARDGTEWAASDEVIDWRSMNPLALLREVRRRRFHRALLLHGPDQYATRAYWRAATLLLTSGAREKVFREFGRRGEGGPVSGIIGGLLKGAVQMIEEAYVAAMGVLLLVPLLIGMAVVDLTEALGEDDLGLGCSVARHERVPRQLMQRAS